jgi:hypothetical protein
MTTSAPGPAGVAAVTTNFVDLSDDINPPPLNGPFFTAYRAASSIMYSALADGAALAVRARFPSVAPSDAFPYLGQDRTVYQGFAEPIASYSLRLEQWLDLLPYEGFPAGMMCALLGYCIPATWTALAPGSSCLVRTVDDSSNWNTYAAGTNPVPLGPLNQPFPISTPIFAITNNAGLFEIQTSGNIQFPTGTTINIGGVVGTGGIASAINTTWVATVIDATHFTLQNSVFTGAYVSGGTVGAPIIGYPSGFVMLQSPNYQNGLGNWQWDSASEPYGYAVPRWWRLWPILYSTGAGTAPFNAPTATWAPATGTITTTVTPASGATPSYYSSTGGSGTSGTEFNWDDGTCWDWAGDGPGVSYAEAYVEASALTAIAKQYKAANVRVPYVIVCYNASYFPPTASFGSGFLPDGTWGSWAKVVPATASGVSGVPSYYTASRALNTVCSFLAGSGENGFGWAGNGLVYTPLYTTINVVP